MARKEEGEEEGRDCGGTPKRSACAVGKKRGMNGKRGLCRYGSSWLWRHQFDIAGAVRHSMWKQMRRLVFTTWLPQDLGFLNMHLESFALGVFFC